MGLLGTNSMIIQTHKCSQTIAKHNIYGWMISTVGNIEDNYKLYDRYARQIEYCPFCGERLR